MAIGTIEHKELPDSLLHEPKGASTASEGEIYVADGEGSGQFQKVSLSSLDIVIPNVPAAANQPVTNTVNVSGTGLSEAALGKFQDVLPHAEIPADVTTRINQNTAESFEIYTNQKIINEDLKSAIAFLRADVNTVITALKNEGIFTDE